VDISVAVEPPPLMTDTEGVIRVGNTRVTLDTVVEAFLEGATAEEIAQQYPSLDLADVYDAIGYYLRRQSEVEAYLLQRQQQAAKVRRQNESRFVSHSVRARLLARRKHNLTHDVSTITRYAYDRVQAGQSMPGVFEVGRAVPIGMAIEDILLLAECSEQSEWEGQVRYLPLR